MDRPIKTGDSVSLRLHKPGTAGAWKVGRLKLASANGKSLAVLIDRIGDNIAAGGVFISPEDGCGVMMLTQKERSFFEDLASGQVYEVRLEEA